MASRGRGIRSRRVEPPKPRRLSSQNSTGSVDGSLDVERLLLDKMVNNMEGGAISPSEASSLNLTLKNHGLLLEQTDRGHMEHVVGVIRACLKTRVLSPTVRLSLLEALELAVAGWDDAKLPSFYYDRKKKELNIRQRITHELGSQLTKDNNSRANVTRTQSNQTDTNSKPIMKSRSFSLVEQINGVEVVRRISSDIYRHDNDTYGYKVSIKEKHVGKVIGKAGANIAQLQRLSDTRISIAKECTSNERHISITSPTPNAIWKVVSMIEHLVETGEISDKVAVKYTSPSNLCHGESLSSINSETRDDHFETASEGDPYTSGSGEDTSLLSRSQNSLNGSSLSGENHKITSKLSKSTESLPNKINKTKQPTLPRTPTPSKIHRSQSHTESSTIAKPPKSPKSPKVKLYSWTPLASGTTSKMPFSDNNDSTSSCDSSSQVIMDTKHVVPPSDNCHPIRLPDNAKRQMSIASDPEGMVLRLQIGDEVLILQCTCESILQEASDVLSNHFSKNNSGLSNGASTMSASILSDANNNKDVVDPPVSVIPASLIPLPSDDDVWSDSDDAAFLALNGSSRSQHHSGVSMVTDVDAARLAATSTPALSSPPGGHPVGTLELSQIKTSRNNSVLDKGFTDDSVTSRQYASGDQSESIDLERLVKQELEGSTFSGLKNSLSETSNQLEHTPRKNKSGSAGIDKYDRLGYYQPSNVMRTPLNPLATHNQIHAVESTQLRGDMAASTRRRFFRITSQNYARKMVEENKGQKVLQYGLNFLLACARSPIAMQPPPAWLGRRDLPEVCISRNNGFNPELFNTTLQCIPWVSLNG